MFAAALRPASFAARAAFKPARLAAVRAISSTAARRSDHPTPEIYGEGAKAGEIPTDVNQSTGLERLQILGALEGVEIFDLKPLDSSRLGTVADPVKVFSAVSIWHIPPGATASQVASSSRMQEPERVIGCTGVPAESHELLWMTLTNKKNRRCPECGSGASPIIPFLHPTHVHTSSQSTRSTSTAPSTLTSTTNRAYSASYFNVLRALLAQLIRVPLDILFVVSFLANV